jgi:proline dehydrogenase
MGAKLAVRTAAASLAIAAVEQRVSMFLASGARHVSGRLLQDAVWMAMAESRAGRLTTLGYWPYPSDPPALIAARYTQAIDAIGDAGIRSSISIKVDLLQFDRTLLMPVLRQGMARGVRVHFDAQAYDTADRTFELVEAGLALGADVSATLPSRWGRSSQDAERLLRLGVPFRIVKGQGIDPSQPKIDPRHSYLELVKLVAGRAAHVGIATHDRRVAEPALDTLQASNTPCSLEQLSSLPRLDFVAERRGLPVRVYVAYGQYGLPYALRQVIRRPAIVGWILRDLLVRFRP